MDLTAASGCSSPMRGLAAAPGHDDLLQRHGWQEGGAGTLVAVLPRAEGQRGRLAVVGSEARRCHSGRGGEERGARMNAVELARGSSAFYRAGEVVGRRGGGR
jgi:hypothetical protein